MKICIEEVSKKLQDLSVALKSHHERAAKELEEADYVDYHSIALTEQEKRDMDFLRSVATKLSDPDILYKAIWSATLQSKTQDLAKRLKCDKMVGIYRFVEKESGLSYIGQSVDIGQRLRQHIKCAAGIDSPFTDKFHKRLFEKGIEAFFFEVVEVCMKEELTTKEKFWIDFYGSVEFGLNSKKGS